MPILRYFLSVTTGLVFQAWLTYAQPLQVHPATIVEYDGALFMPYHETPVEVSYFTDPGIARRSPSQVTILKKKLEACTALFSQDSLLKSPRGLKVTYRGTVLPPPAIQTGQKSIMASFETALYTTLARDSAPAWEATPDARVTIWFNNPAKLAGSPVINDIYVEPRTTGDFFGHPEMDRISAPYRIVAVKNNTLPFFLPVTREDFVLTLISYFQSSIEKNEKTGNRLPTATVHDTPHQKREDGRVKFYNDLEKIRKMDPELADKLMQAYLEAGVPGAGNGQGGSGQGSSQGSGQVDQNIVLNSWREAVRKLKTEMNAMSPTERKSQAWWSSTEETNVSGLTYPGASGSRPLVRINRALIDPTLAPSSIQLMVVEWSMVPGTGFSETTGYNLAFGTLSHLSTEENLWIPLFRLSDQ